MLDGDPAPPTESGTVSLCGLRSSTSGFGVGASQASFFAVFGQPFVERFALCYRTVVLSVLSCLSVTLVYCGQTVRWIKMKLDVKAGLGPAHIVLDGVLIKFLTPAKGAQQPLFLAHVYCDYGRPSQLLLSSCLTWLANTS